MDVSLRHWSGWFAAIVLLAGCQAPNASIELLESELRWMEDQLYSLDRQLDQTCLQLASAQNANRALQRELARLQETGPTPAPGPRPRSTGAAPSRAQTENLVPPGVDVPEVEDFDEDALQVPRIEMGPAGDPIPSVVPPSTNPSNEPPLLDPNLDTSGLDSADARPGPVSRIVVNRHLTGGYDFDGHPGDEGLLVVVEPVDAAGQYVALPGDLVIELRDPAQSPTDRVARWEFDGHETVGLLRESLLGRGIHLKLPWPGDAPTTERLLLSVQYRPADGQTLMAERSIRVDLGFDRADVAPAAIADGRPDPLLPTHRPQLSQLFPARAMTMPGGPLDDTDSVVGTSGPSPALQRRVARTPRNSTSGARRIPWSPYR